MEEDDRLEGLHLEVHDRLCGVRLPPESGVVRVPARLIAQPVPLLEAQSHAAGKQICAILHVADEFGPDSSTSVPSASAASM